MADLDALAAKFGGTVAPTTAPPSSSNVDAIAAKFGGTSDPLSNPNMATAGISPWQLALEGAGQGMNSLFSGIKERLGMLQPSDIDALRHLDAPLLASTESSAPVGGSMGVHVRPGSPLTSPGAAGSIVGHTAPLIPLMAIPGANTVAGGALIGGGAGFIEPTGTGESVAANTLTGAGTGAIVPAAVRVVPSAVKALVQPFYNAGRENLAGDVLNRFGATGSAVPASTPGWQPTLAEATQSPGASILQKGAGAADPDVGAALANRQVSNNAAAVSALSKIAGTPADQNLAAAIRDYMSKPLYQQAAADGIDPEMAAAMKPQLQNLMERPAFQQAVTRAKRIFGENTVTLDPNGDVRGLQMVKQALDDMIQKAPADSSIGNTELASLKQTRGDLISTMQDLSPAQRAADTNYATFSRPINESQVIEGLKQKLVPALTDQNAPTRMKAATFANTLQDLDAQIPQLSGYAGATVKNTMSPGAMTGLNGVLSDLTRRATADDLASLARGGNSATSQNLATQNIMRSVLGPLGLPDGVASAAAASTIGRTVARPAAFAYQIPEQEIQKIIGRATLDPAYAARLSALARQPGLPPNLQKALGTLSDLALPGTLGVVGAQR